MAQPYQVVQAYDRALIKEIPADDAAALEARLEAAFRLIKVRDGALKPYQRSAILIRAAVLLGEIPALRLPGQRLFNRYRSGLAGGPAAGCLGGHDQRPHRVPR